MKLSTWAKLNNLSYRSAHRHFKLGMIKNARQLETGTIVIDENITTQKEEYTVVYARVSSSENKCNLDSQAVRIINFCNANGWVVNEVIKECASGMNDNRPKLQKILTNSKVTRLVIEHKDRLTRFGFNYIKILFGGNIIIMNTSASDSHDLMQDFISLVTCFCARIYGLRRSKRLTQEIISKVSCQ